MLRTTISVFTGLLVLLLLSSWTVFLAWRSQRLSVERDLISLEAESAIARFSRGGVERLADDIAFEDERIWEEEWLWFAFEEEEFLFRLTGPESEDEDLEEATIAGFPGLYAEFDWDEGAELDHDDLDAYPLISYRVGLDDEHSLLVARFVPVRIRELSEILMFSSLILLVSGVPLIAATGFALRARVRRRIAALSLTAQAVGEGNLEKRAPVSDRQDDFDDLAKAFNRMLDRVATLTRNMRSVSVGVAHDLKTPVSNIDGRLQLIERDRKSPELISEHIERSRGHIAALQRTLDALLRLGEIEAGARRSAFTLVDLSLLCADLVESFEPVLAEMDKTLSAEIPSGLFVYGDPDLLSQLIINLLENIGEHARDGANAWLALTRSGDNVLLVVGDDGPGIAEPLREVLFERFIQLDSSRQSSGNGLGLSIVRAITELHHGEVRLRADTRGAVFEVQLPSSRANLAQELSRRPRPEYKSV
ncbi:MAG: HAMP domain-containing sensor histidine kinase [Pseudomonadota bacterium]